MNYTSCKEFFEFSAKKLILPIPISMMSGISLQYTYTTGDVQGAPVSLGTGTFDSIWRDKLLKWNTTEMKYDAVG